jgi:hypothetical protein
MLIKTGHVIEFNIGEFVYLKVDKDQSKRMIVSIALRPCNAVQYEIYDGHSESWHFGIELSAERDILLATSN